MTARSVGAVRRIAVIGAGVVGVAIAARLAERGDDVVLLSAEPIGSTSVSRASFAWANAHGKTPESYRRLNQEGIRRHAALSAQHPTPWFVRTGAETDQGVHPDEGYVDVDALIAAHLQDLTRAGALVRGEVRVASLDEVRRRYGPVDVIVVAAGAATAQLVASDGHRPARLPSSIGPDGFLVRIDADDHPIDRVRSVAGLQVRPDGDGRVVAQSLGIEEALRHDGMPASLENVWPALRIELARRLDWVVPDEAAVRIDHAPRPLAPDGLPVVGRVSEDVYIALAHSGVTLSVLLADLVARDLHGDTDPRLLPFLPDRSDES